MREKERERGEKREIQIGKDIEIENYDEKSSPGKLATNSIINIIPRNQ